MEKESVKIADVTDATITRGASVDEAVPAKDETDAEIKKKENDDVENG